MKRKNFIWMLIRLHSPPNTFHDNCIVMVCSVVGFWFGFDVYHNSYKIIKKLSCKINKWSIGVRTKINVTSPRYRAFKPGTLNRIGKSMMVTTVNEQSFSLQSDKSFQSTIDNNC